MKGIVYRMRYMGRLNVILIASAMLLATGCRDNAIVDDNPIADDNPTEDAAPTVAGTVTNASTGEVVAGAQVSLGTATVTTAPNGHFEFTDLTPGPLPIRCIVAGYQVFQQEVTVTSGRITYDIGLIRLRSGLPDGSSTRTYDLTASVEGFDPAWRVDMTGNRYTAVLKIHWDSTKASAKDANLSGSLEDWRLIEADGTETLMGFAPLVGHVDGAGNFVLEGDRLLWAMLGTLTTSAELSGSWGCCGHISGSFKAVRRSSDDDIGRAAPIPPILR